MVLREFTVKVCDFFFEINEISSNSSICSWWMYSKLPRMTKFSWWMASTWLRIISAWLQFNVWIVFKFCWELYRMSCNGIEDEVFELSQSNRGSQVSVTKKALSSFGSPYFKDQILLTWTPKLNNRTKNFCLAGISKTFQQVRSEEIKRKGTRWNGKLGAQDEFHRKSLLRRSRSVI